MKEISSIATSQGTIDIPLPWRLLLEYMLIVFAEYSNMHFTLIIIR